MTTSKNHSDNPTLLSGVNFGQPEAEHDKDAIANAFYEAQAWRSVANGGERPFVVGRKGSGKSAIAARLEHINEHRSNCCFLRIVPASFRHVEIRDLLSCLVSKNASYQYIYRKVWEGIILGQIVRHIQACQTAHNSTRIPPELQNHLRRFNTECSFYVTRLEDALSDVISRHVKDSFKKTDALSQVELRKRLEPYPWGQFTQSLASYTAAQSGGRTSLFVAIDGLDEHWDTSTASLFFLAELLAVAKNYSAIFGTSVRFIVCLRDSIFRALVDTKSVEYDKIESLIINLEWNTRSLFELIARRVAPHKRQDLALSDLRSLLPETVDDIAIEEYLARHVLQRPRDYVNFFRMLQAECGPEPRAGEGHVHDALAKYCANRLMDLENEFGFTYPGISKLITALYPLPELFTKEQLLEEISALCLKPSFRGEAPGLIMNYGQPQVLARILLSIGAIGTYDSTLHAIRFVHEFSETRVSALWESAVQLSIHPVYCYKKPALKAPAGSSEALPAILTHPADYLAEKNVPRADLEDYDQKMERKRADLVAGLQAITTGQQHYRRFELWVKETISVCFVGDLVNAEEQITNEDKTKRFEVVYDIIGTEPPWSEIKMKYATHRLLVECKNTDEPTDGDLTKLDRDMASLDLNVAFLAYRGSAREPRGRLLTCQRALYTNSKKQRLIVALSDSFLLQCLSKRNSAKTRQNLNALWRDHVHRYLPV